MEKRPLNWCSAVAWLGSRVVSVLDSGEEGPRFKSQARRCLRQTVHTHRASVYQAAKLVAALFRFARVTAGLVESNGSLPPGLWLTSPAGWLPKTGISSGTLRSAIEYLLSFSAVVLILVAFRPGNHLSTSISLYSSYWYYTHTHLTAFFSGTTQVSRYHKGKTNLDFTEARDSEW